MKCSNLFCVNYTKKINNKYNCKLNTMIEVRTCKQRKNYNWFYRNLFLLINERLIIDQDHLLKIKLKLKQVREYWKRKLL